MKTITPETLRSKIGKIVREEVGTTEEYSIKFDIIEKNQRYKITFGFEKVEKNEKENN